MKTTYVKISLVALLLLGFHSCKKGEYVESAVDLESSSAATEMVSDSISFAATQEIQDKKFIKMADVNIEVKDVYEATIAIEKALKEKGGFVTSSKMQTQVLEENTYNTSDSESVLVRKFQMENTMQVRVPTPYLGQFLQEINDKKLFLHSRNISAEDVTANIKFAELEGKRIKKTGSEISTAKNTLKKIDKADENRAESNYHQLSSLQLTDQLKYSTVDLYLREPEISVSTISIANSQNIDNQYKYNFFYEMKNAVVEGFYLVQKIVIGLIMIWPLLLLGGLIYFFIRKRKSVLSQEKQ